MQDPEQELQDEHDDRVRYFKKKRDEARAAAIGNGPSALDWLIHQYPWLGKMIDDLRADNEHLKAVISTPEVYAGVVTAECEKNWAALILQEKLKNEELKTEIRRLKFMVDNGLGYEDLKEDL